VSAFTPILVSYPFSIASGITLLVLTSRAGSQTGTQIITHIGTVTWSTSVALNVLCTILISGRLISHQRRLSVLTSGNSAGTRNRRKSGDYLSVAAIFAESAALYSIVGIIYIPIFGTNSALEPPLATLWGSVAVRLL
jgi:hypothetical protein